MRYVGDTKTVILLGNIRVRQLRVKKNFRKEGPDGYCNLKPQFKPESNPRLPRLDCFPPFVEGPDLCDPDDPTVNSGTESCKMYTIMGFGTVRMLDANLALSVALWSVGWFSAPH